MILISGILYHAWYKKKWERKMGRLHYLYLRFSPPSIPYSWILTCTLGLALTQMEVGLLDVTGHFQLEKIARQQCLMSSTTCHIHCLDCVCHSCKTWQWWLGSCCCRELPCLWTWQLFWMWELYSPTGLAAVEESAASRICPGGLLELSLRGADWEAVVANLATFYSGVAAFLSSF